MRLVTAAKADGYGLSSLMHVGRVPVVALAVPIAVAGRPPAVLVGYFRADRSPLQTYVEQLRLGRTGHDYVVDAEGWVLASSDPRAVGTRMANPAVARLTAGKRGELTFGHGRARTFAVFAPFEIGGWGGITTQDHAEFFGPISRGHAQIALALVVLLALASSVIITQNHLRETARRRFHERLAHQARHDGLTDLANRAMFHETLTRALARGRRRGRDLAVLFVDLDGFKQVNDTLGHDAGDELLVTVADRLRGCVRAEDALARMGGDEFTVLVEDFESIEAITTLARRIIESVSQPAVVRGQRVSVGASVGIAYSHHGADSVEELLRDADLAMYKAKDGGKAGYVVFDRDLQVGLRP
jgi:diguanylate cyclase (GGDEF)-like protein